MDAQILIDEQPGDEKSLTTTNRNLPQSSIAGIDVNALLSKAIDHNTPVETMEKLIAMARQLKADYALEQFNIALSEFQAECPEIEKNKGIYNSKQKGGRLRYKYAPLESIIKQIKPILKKYGFSYTIKTEQTKDSFTAICEVRHIDGHFEQTPFIVPIDPDAYMTAPQKVGAASTYAKRYAFCNAFGIMTGDEDTDANDMEPPRQEKPRYPPNPKGNTMPKLTAAQAKKEILEMIQEDQTTHKTLDETAAADIVSRIEGDKPYKGGWLALHEKLKTKFEAEWPVF